MRNREHSVEVAEVGKGQSAGAAAEAPLALVRGTRMRVGGARPHRARRVRGAPRSPAALPRGLTSPSAAGGTSPVLTVFQATSSCCVGPGGSAAAISTQQHPEPLGAARGDDAELGSRARGDETYERRAKLTYSVCALLRGSAQARAALQWRRLEWPATMTQQGAAMQNYNNELVKCERPRGGPAGQAGRAWGSPACRPRQ